MRQGKMKTLLWKKDKERSEDYYCLTKEEDKRITAWLWKHEGRFYKKRYDRIP